MGTGWALETGWGYSKAKALGDLWGKDQRVERPREEPRRGKPATIMDLIIELKHKKWPYWMLNHLIPEGTYQILLKILDLFSHPWRPWGPCTIRDRSWSRLERPWRSWTAFGGPKVSRAGTSGVWTVKPTFLLGGHDQVMKAYMALIAKIAILSNVANDDNHGVLGLGVLIWVSVSVHLVLVCASIV